MLIFNKNYFTIAILFFFIEVAIAFFVNDSFVRPYLGDVFVVILIYCFLKSFLKLPVEMAAVIVLLFAFCIEFLQFFAIVEKLHLEKSKIARTVIGTSFSWMDVLMYCIGIAVVIVAEKYSSKRNISNGNTTL